ncbi:MAG TPA: hypothetical protein V6D21_23560 [Candidatus Obscuribacterales bacterium]
MNYPEVVESVFSKISSIPEPNPLPHNKDWILTVLYHRTVNPRAKYPSNGVIKSILDFGLEFAPLEDWNISLEDYSVAKLNQQNRWLTWRESLTPIGSGMKKTIDNEQEF